MHLTAVEMGKKIQNKENPFYASRIAQNCGTFNYVEVQNLNGIR